MTTEPTQTYVARPAVALWRGRTPTLGHIIKESADTTVAGQFTCRRVYPSVGRGHTPGFTQSHDTNSPTPWVDRG
jgi:hypothetical protein